MTFLMATRAAVRWLAFASSLAVVFTLPFAVLWAFPGFLLGMSLAVIFLVALGWHGPERIARRLAVRPLTTAQAPALHAIVEEHCRRLGLTAPHVGVIETPAINFAVFGFTRRSSWLVVTRGALLHLRRAELGALVGRELAYLWTGDAYGDSWLSQFLALVDHWLAPMPTSRRHIYPFRLFLRQVLLYPLTLLPAYLLKGGSDAIELDRKATRLTRRPREFAEGLRRMEANLERTPFRVPFSARHLFVVAPPALDPMARVFFETDELAPRIASVDRELTQVANLA